MECIPSPRAGEGKGEGDNLFSISCPSAFLKSCCSTILQLNLYCKLCYYNSIVYISDNIVVISICYEY
jgi:hypothetical protein